MSWTWTPSAPLAASTFGHYHQVDLDNTPVATELSYGLSNELNWRLNDHWSLKSLTGYRSDHSIGVQDGDGFSPDAHRHREARAVGAEP